MYDVRTGDKKRLERDGGMFDFEMIERLEETVVVVMKAIGANNHGNVASIDLDPCGSALELPPGADEACSCVALSTRRAYGHTSKAKPVGQAAGNVSPMEKHFPPCHRHG